MKCGILVLGWCGAFGAIACGGQVVTISDSGGSSSITPATGEGAGHGGTSSHASGGSSSTSPSSGGSTSSNPGFGGGPSQAGTSNGGATGNVPGMPDPGSATCQNFTPCGGDLLGDWRFLSVCTSPPLPVGEPPFCAADEVTSNISGTLSFLPDGRVIPATTYTNHHVVPASCLPALGGCANPGGALSGCKSAADGSCICDSSNESGTVDGESYVNVDAGNYFLLTESAGTPPISVYFCQIANRLAMRATDQGRIVDYQLTRP